MWVFVLILTLFHTNNLNFVIVKSCSPEQRENLRESFVKLFGEKDASKGEVQTKLSKRIPATLCPLKTYTELVRPLIKNSLVQNVLQQNFRNKRVLPYIDEDGSTFHEPLKFTKHFAFHQKSIYDFFEDHLSNGLAHLVDLAAILTRADLKRYFAYFTEAEMKRPMRPKVAKRSLSP